MGGGQLDHGVVHWQGGDAYSDTSGSVIETVNFHYGHVLVSASSGFLKLVH